MSTKRDYLNWSKDELVRELKKVEKRKKYGIVWEDKPEQVAEVCKEKLPVLEEDKHKVIKTDELKPTNIFIEGDNYHALSVLNYTHKGAIDVIYIDPPYNTGSDDFKYNDRIVDKEDSYRHSKWLSFMEKRLKLAKNVLKTDGVIFISIDDNESAQLKLLCNEIFDEANLVEVFYVQVRYASKSLNEKDHFQKLIEQVLVYAKNIESFKEKPIINFYDYSGDFGNIRHEGQVDFRSGKKPTKMLMNLINLHPNKNALVLDFFAGSGSSGHATLLLNDEDEGGRKFILCTNNENNIASDICYPRIANVIKGYNSVKGLDGYLK